MCAARAIKDVFTKAYYHIKEYNSSNRCMVVMALSFVSAKKVLCSMRVQASHVNGMNYIQVGIFGCELLQ